MATKTINKKPSGLIKLPPSKSGLHRNIIIYFLAKYYRLDNSEIPPLSPEDQKTLTEIAQQKKYSDDIKATANAMKLLLFEPNVPIDCHDSGTTLRFLIGISLLMNRNVVLTGSEQLMSRTNLPFFDALKKAQVQVNFDGKTIGIEKNDSLDPPVHFSIAGNISSQYISSLLTYLSFIGGGVITLTKPLESKGYVDMTIDVLKKYGVKVKFQDDVFIVTSPIIFKLPYPNLQTAIDGTEGDFSQSAFFIVSKIFGAPIEIAGLDEKPSQGDKEILNIIKKMGVTYKFEKGILKIKSPNISTLKGQKISLKDIPDLTPPLALLLSLAQTPSLLYDGKRLRIKESDRLKSVAETLNQLGANIEIIDHSLKITPVKSLKGGKVNSFKDHRIVMMSAVASLVSKNPVQIEGFEAVNKSYPTFFEDFLKI